MAVSTDDLAALVGKPVTVQLIGTTTLQGVLLGPERMQQHGYSRITFGIQAGPTLRPFDAEHVVTITTV